jgi:hypothetical protein
MSEIRTSGSEESKWLLRLCTILLAAFSYQYNANQIALKDALSELTEKVSDHTGKIGEHTVLIRELDNAQNRLEKTLDNLRTVPPKLYALKPDDIKIKRKY